MTVLSFFHLVAIIQIYFPLNVVETLLVCSESGSSHQSHRSLLCAQNPTWLRQRETLSAPTATLIETKKLHIVFCCGAPCQHSFSALDWLVASYQSILFPIWGDLTQPGHNALEGFITCWNTQQLTWTPASWYRCARGVVSWHEATVVWPAFWHSLFLMQFF